MSQKQPYDGSRPLKDGRRELFCQEAVARNDINSAYELAGFKRPRGNAHRMAREPKVEARLAYLWKRAADHAELMGGRLLAKCDLIANANMFDFWDRHPESGKIAGLKSIDAIPHVMGGAIQEISYDANGNPKLKLYAADDMLKFLIERSDPSVKKLALTDPSGTQAAAPFIVEIVKFADAPATPDQAAA